MIKPHVEQPVRASPRGRVFLFLFMAAIASLCFLLGAAVLFFEVPPSGFLRKAFLGAEAWFERERLSSQATPISPASVRLADLEKNSEKAFHGFTLYTTWATPDAFLIDMRGDVVHKWSAPFSTVWPSPDHVRKRALYDINIYIFSFHLFRNGDLLVVYQAYDDTPYGYGLAKVDKDSKVLWRYSEKVHHAVDVGEDGTIYALTHEILHEAPSRLEFVRPPCLLDYVVTLSPAGKELSRVSVIEAFRDSPYALLLNPDRQRKDGDLLHTNSVQVLGTKLASQFPQFKPGQLLISLRELDTIAILDTKKRSVVWATRGPWEGQHDPQFLENGSFLIFDNLGSANAGRLLEYDPRTQAFPWSYSRKDGFLFKSPAVPKGLARRGSCQRLGNGNTLIVNTWAGELMEITYKKELVWSCSCHDHVTSARRYHPSQIDFLKK